MKDVERDVDNEVGDGDVDERLLAMYILLLLTSMR